MTQLRAERFYGPARKSKSGIRINGATSSWVPVHWKETETDTETGVYKAELEFRSMENQLNIYKHVEIQAIRIFIYLMILVLTAI